MNGLESLNFFNICEGIQPSCYPQVEDNYPRVEYNMFSSSRPMTLLIQTSQS